MYFRYVEPPPKTIGQAEHLLQEALWEHWWGRGQDGRDILALVAEFCAERTLSGTYPKKPIEVAAKEGSARSNNEESADVYYTIR